MKLLTTAVILLILGYASFNYLSHHKSGVSRDISTKEHSKIFDKDNLELSYIVDVINNGSNRLNFKGGEMEGGFIPKEKARDVACYLLKLRGEPCKEPFAKDSALFFSSNCTGCHGIEGRGIGDSYPSLYNKPFLGFNKWLKENMLK